MSKKQRRQQQARTRPSGTTPDPQQQREQEQRDLPGKIAKEARLWGLSFVCAALGGLAVWRFGSLMVGIGVFALSLLILGMALYNYEKRRAASNTRGDTQQ